jgi:putative NIF3 family GTP cyclohydrolase 1 type 2
MTIKQIYQLAIEMGIKADPRGEKKVKELLKEEKEKFKDLKEEEQKEYDKERFFNPYADTRILVGDPNKKVKTILTGIDIETEEILLADRLSQKGKKIDLIITHHPEGKAYAALDKAVYLQIDIFQRYGVPVNIAEDIMKARIEEVAQQVHPINHNRTIDAAKILGFALISVHSAADNLGQKFLQEIMDKKKPEKVSDLLKILKEIPEYKQAIAYQAGPKIFVGDPERKTGKIKVGFTGGTSTSKEIYKELAQAGIGTIIGMHVPKEHIEEAKNYHLNLIMAGHISSDSLGMNLFLDELEKRGLEIIPCSGLIRVKRI